MLELRPVQFNQIQHWFVDFQKKSKCFELPADTTENIGIYLDNGLIGYFIVQVYTDGTLEIQQGYLKPMVRHRALSYESMGLLQTLAKDKGLTNIILKASRSLNAYTKFMGNLGFKPESIIYTKRI